MIIYQSSIRDFIELSSKKDLLVAKIISAMKEKIGYSVSEKEKESWRTTLSNIAPIFSRIQNNEEQYILLEFKIPKSKKRIDIILVGCDGIVKNLLIIEMKGWSKIDIQNNSNLLKINTSYRESIHPAYEAYDYKKILDDRFSSLTRDFTTHACALLPNFKPQKENPLENIKYNEILKLINTYTDSTKDEFITDIHKLFNSFIDVEDLKKINKLEYKPSKSFLEHIENEFQKIELIDTQRLAFEKIIDAINNNYVSKKTLITISGAAGSGKTVVAFKVLGYLIKKQKDVSLVLPGPEFRESVKKTFGNNTISEFIGGANHQVRNDYLIIDEAHKATSNITASAFYGQILKNANFVIALIDDMQVINKKGITRKEIEKLSTKYNFEVINLNLQEHFRNGGDSTYVEWLKNWIFSNDNGQIEFVQNFFKFSILDEYSFNDKYKKMYKTQNVRLLSFWTQTWDIQNLEDGLPLRNVKIGNTLYAWNPNWQWLQKIKKNNEQLKLGKDLQILCEKKNFNLDKKGHQYIGYFNTAQGSEFEYIFVHIPKLFFWNEETNKIDVDLNELNMSEMNTQVWATNKIKNHVEKERKIKLNKKYFLNRLFINLTRGTKGTFVYIEDELLRKKIGERVR